jgi:hypothetical protein
LVTPRHVHVLALLEQLDGESLTHFIGLRSIDAELLDVPRGRQIALLELAEHRLLEARFLVGAEAELDGRVAVTLGRAHFGHVQGPASITVTGSASPLSP